MEEFMKKEQPCMSVSSSPSSSTPSPPSVLSSLHKDSQTIAKVVKPKIRIIHIFAPEIIKTDVANFRELVQRLTGKPTDHHQKGCKKKKPRISRRRTEDHQPRCNNNNSNNFHPGPDKPPAAAVLLNKKVELVRSCAAATTGGFMSCLGTRDRVVKEEDQEFIWNNNGASSGGFLGGFADLDGFIQELGCDFPLMPMAMDAAAAASVTANHHHHHHLHGFEEAQLS